MRIGPALLAAVVSALAGTPVSAEETNPAAELEGVRPGPRVRGGEERQ